MFFRDLRPDQAIDHTDMQSRDFNEGPGEVDMLIGFFFMNGACIGELIVKLNDKPRPRECLITKK